MAKKMRLMLQRADRDLIENITEWKDGIYSLHFKGYEDCVWCKSISEIFIALRQFKESGCVNTNEYGEIA